MEKKDFLTKLSEIQTRMKAPKSLYNSFGGYNYRSAEGILEAFKEYESEYKVALVLKDEITEVGGRIYVKATAQLFDCESDIKISTTAYAREAETKKGMDDSQITGTASSYARKYALNGLLLLDDSKDADTDEYKKQTEPPLSSDGDKPASPAMIKTIESLCKKHDLNPEKVCSGFGVTWKGITNTTAGQMLGYLKKTYKDG